MGARIVIRVDGSHQVGMGHVYRMENLAETLTEAGVESLTFCGRADEQVGTWLQKRKFKVEILPYDGEVIAQLAACLRACGANLLINDILDTDIEYMAAVRSVDCAIVNFDDGGPGRHLADCRINALPSKILPQEQGEPHLPGTGLSALRWGILANDCPSNPWRIFDLFAYNTRWKRYIREYLGGRSRLTVARIAATGTYYYRSGF